MILDSKCVLTYIAILCQGDWEAIATFLREKRKIDPQECLKTVSALPCRSVTIMEEEYPRELRNARQPPFVLFYQGNLSLLDDAERCIALIGSGRDCEYGLAQGKRFAKTLASEGATVISAISKGVNEKVLSEALPFGRAVAVLANGVDVYYPAHCSALQREIREKGLLVSEFPPQSKPGPKALAARNRAIASLSSYVLVASTHQGDGTLSIVASALSQGRIVGAFPYRLDEDNVNNSLILEGAEMITDPDDVLQHAGLKKKKSISINN